MTRAAVILTLPLALVATACSPTDPTAQAIANIEDAADTRADALRAEADAQADRLEDEASGALANTGAGFDQQLAQARAEGLRSEARVLRERGDARAKAEESRARAEVDAIKAR